MTIHKSLIWATQKLKYQRIKTSSLDAEVLLSFVLKKPKEFLFTYPEKKIAKIQENKFNDLVRRRLTNEPIAYLVNSKEFYGLNFYVDKRVLIPGPDTELIVDEVIKLIAKTKWRTKNRKLTIADIGTGSGAIAITLAKHFPKAKLYATDISLKALTVAHKNTKLHKVNIKFYQGDLLSPLKNTKLDVIIANLPYGDQQIWSKRTVQPALEIKHEPELALFSKKSGLAILERFIKQLANLKFLPRYIFIEIDHSQEKQVSKMINKYLKVVSVQTKKDLARLNRLIIIKL